VTVAAFDLHPNVEIRLFNPLAHRRVRLLSVFDLARVNHRMHNKVFTMDNAITVVGGRNIGDHYFGVDGVSNFRDIDFAALGEIVGEVSVSFDAFWNSPWAIPVSALTGRSTPSREQAQVLHDQKQALLQGAGEFPYRLDSTREELHERLAELKDDLVWAEADVVYDLPDKVGNVGAGGLVETFRDLFASTQEELLIESAYFIPGQEGVALLRELCERGVRVRVLTNSLASNDVAAAHAGYARYRRALIEAGVELHELRADPGSIRSHWSLLAADSRASLHSKALVFDRKAVFVGTLNLDPRSWSINTEIGIVVHGKELAGLVADFLDEGARAENSYTLALQGKRLVWLDEGGQARNSEPDASIWRRIGATMAGWLPIEDQL
jgi:putative cardiolipin synthase